MVNWIVEMQDNHSFLGDEDAFGTISNVMVTLIVQITKTKKIAVSIY